MGAGVQPGGAKNTGAAESAEQRRGVRLRVLVPHGRRPQRV